jgi:AraC-like DNA-binding protein
MMRQADAKTRFKKLLEELFHRSVPGKVFLVSQTGIVPGLEHAALYDGARVSVCLFGTGRYCIRSGNRVAEVRLKRGEAVFVLPNCVMEPHPRSSYLSFGIVLLPQFTRLLLARKLVAPKKGFQHSFLLSCHTPAQLDEDGRDLVRLISRCGQRPPESLYLRGLVGMLLLRVREMLEDKPVEHPHGKAFFTWRAACQFVLEHLNQPIGREDVARFLGLHANHISRLFARFDEGSFNRYVLAARLNRARSLLKNPALNISEIARASGFSDANYFIRCYRKKFGKSPGKARAH